MRSDPVLDVERMDRLSHEVYGPGGTSVKTEPKMYRSVGVPVFIDPDEIRTSLIDKQSRVKAYGPRPASERGVSRFSKITGMFALAAALSLSVSKGLDAPEQVLRMADAPAVTVSMHVPGAPDGGVTGALESLQGRLATLQALALEVAPLNMEALRQTVDERADIARDAVQGAWGSLAQSASAQFSGVALGAAQPLSAEFSEVTSAQIDLSRDGADSAGSAIKGRLAQGLLSPTGGAQSQEPGHAMLAEVPTGEAIVTQNVALTPLERDIAAIQSLCKEKTDRMACARAVHDFDPYVSLVLAVEDLPKHPYFPAAGADAGTPNLPGGYSIKMRKAAYGAERVIQDLKSAGFSLEETRLLMNGKDRKKIRAMEVPAASALALIRIVKDDYEQIARASVSTAKAPQAFDRLQPAQRAALTYAAYNTGTIYPKAATAALHLSLEQDRFAATAFGKTKMALKVGAARIYGLIDQFRKEVTPKYRVHTAAGAEWVDNHRLGGYVAGWMKGQGPAILADQDRHEYDDRMWVAKKLSPEPTRMAQTRQAPRIEPVWQSPAVADLRAVGVPGASATLPVLGGAMHSEATRAHTISEGPDENEAERERSNGMRP